ncbi:hypothetical protein A3860_12180 [Niastella vici]|uniref:Uncharacterized protein n=1 Tax=Niastella vici TaxID=1703345 RepID=A0A1V9G6I6_9BACT|nr:hypothetical protein [Niastella vici]OQP66255.1 hypothetical protein A3860_12180 [Niastella vici]
MLAVHGFNLAGYTLLFDYFIQQSNEQLVQQLDNHQYNDNELIEVTIPLHTPYLTSWSDYERVDGEAEVNGLYYTYVKRKIHNDTLYLLCLPNRTKTQLTAARIDYAHKVHDVPSNAAETGALKKNPAGSEYHQPAAPFTFTVITTVTGEQVPHAPTPVLHAYSTAPYHPPRV